MDILEKIRKYRLARNWTEYQLAEKSALPQSTISSWYRKKQVPTIPSMQKICDAFGITLAQFFADDNAQTACLSKEQREVLNEWNRLSKRKKSVLLNLIKEL
ncbi:MAG: helix-turn-helix transcriptional regulator [Treponema sp.]|nr:helix-turn-helix transcriptional regulator [Treponema sp.]